MMATIEIQSMKSVRSPTSITNKTNLEYISGWKLTL